MSNRPTAPLTSPPDEFLYKLGLLNKLRRRRESVARAQLKPPTEQSALGGGAASEKPFVTLRDMRRIYKIRHSSPATAQRLRERHRAGCEVHPPGADAIYETKGTTPYMFPSWDSPSKYAHVMLVAADAELPAFDILAHVTVKPGVNPTAPDTDSGACYPWNKPLSTPMNHTPLHD